MNDDLIYFLSKTFSSDISINKPIPEEFLLLTFGSNPAYKEGLGEFDILFDKSMAEEVIKNNNNRPVMVDYDHASMLANPSNPAEAMKAAGWGKLSIKDDGMYLTEIGWTPNAQSMLKNGEAQFTSPVLRGSDKRINRLDNVALTNMPALKNNAALMMNKKIGVSKMTEQEMNEIIAENAALKLNQKRAEDTNKLINEELKTREASDLIDQAIAEGKLGKADKTDMLALSQKSGVDTLKYCLSKLSVSMPKVERYQPKQLNSEVEVKTEISISPKIEEVIYQLSMKTSDGNEPVIKTAADRQLFLSKLTDEKTAERLNAITALFIK